MIEHVFGQCGRVCVWTMWTIRGCCSWRPQRWLEAFKAPLLSPLRSSSMSRFGSISSTLSNQAFKMHPPSIRLLVYLQLQEKPPFSLFQLHVLSVHILYLFAGTHCLLFHHNIFILNGSFYFTSRRRGSQPSNLSEVPFLLLPLINCRHKSFGYCY